METDKNIILCDALASKSHSNADNKRNESTLRFCWIFPFLTVCHFMSFSQLFFVPQIRFYGERFYGMKAAVVCPRWVHKFQTQLLALVPKFGLCELRTFLFIYNLYVTHNSICTPFFLRAAIHACAFDKTLNGIHHDIIVYFILTVKTRSATFQGTIDRYEKQTRLTIAVYVRIHMRWGSISNYSHIPCKSLCSCWTQNKWIFTFSGYDQCEQ